MIKLEVGLNDGTLLIENVEAYNALDLEEKLNDRDAMMIAIGNTIFNKNMIKMIKPIN